MEGENGGVINEISFLKTGDPVLHGDGYGDEGDGKVVVEY